MKFAGSALALLAWGHPALADDLAWQALRDGGKVILMRHAAVEPGRGKGNPLLRDPGCAKERNLSSQGREEAAKIGEAFTRRSIRIGDVLASPYCRTMDTAKIAFGQGTPAEFLSLLEGLTPEDAAKNTAATAERIGAYSGSANLVMVSHEPNIAAISFDLLGTGEMLVLQPRGGSDFDVIGKIGAEGEEK